VPFNDAGRANLALGWFDEPPLLKLWYPGGQLGIIYLDAGLPEAGEPLVIDVTRNRGVEIDLQLTGSVREIAEEKEFPLRIATRTQRGDSMLVGFPVTESGVHRVYGVHGESAVVACAATINGKLTELAIENVKLRKSGLSPCTLVVPGEPRVLRLVDTARQPLPGLWIEVREIGDPTTWLDVGQTNLAGEITLPVSNSLRYSPRVVDDAGRRMIVDQLANLAAGGGASEVSAAWSEPRNVQVFVDGAPQSGIDVEISGAHADLAIWVEPTLADGKTEPWRISIDSTPRASARSTEYWSSSSFVMMDAPTNRVDLFTTGVIFVPPSVSLSDIRHQALGSTVAQWVETQRVQKSDSGGQSGLTVPVGDYVVNRGEGRSDLLVLRPGQQLQVAP
jgi:hypothetical protein